MDRQAIRTWLTRTGWLCILILATAAWIDSYPLLEPDEGRNAEIARQVGDAVVNTPTREGLRRGLCYINVCDLVISGDSFGMHAAIGLKKHLIVWFGGTGPQEIDLFGRGIKLIPLGLECSPCWKKSCPFNLECIQHRCGDLHRRGALPGDMHRILNPPWMRS